MESLLTEEEKRQIIEENTAKVARETTLTLNTKRVIALMGKMNISSKEAMDYLEFTEEERAEVEKRIYKNI